MRIKDNLAFFEKLSRENSKSEIGSKKVKPGFDGPRRGSRGPLKSNPLPPLKKALSTELTVSDKNEDLNRYSLIQMTNDMFSFLLEFLPGRLDRIDL